MSGFTWQRGSTAAKTIRAAYVALAIHVAGVDSADNDTGTNVPHCSRFAQIPRKSSAAACSSNGKVATPPRLIAYSVAS